MSTQFSKGDKVRCIETWTTHVIDRGGEYMVDAWRVDSEADVMEVLVNGEWVPARYFEKFEPEPREFTITGKIYGTPPEPRVVYDEAVAAAFGANIAGVFIPGDAFAEPEDKADLYVEPEPLKEGDWVQMWARVETVSVGAFDMSVYKGSDRFAGLVRDVRPDALIRTDDTPPWVKVEQDADAKAIRAIKTALVVDGGMHDDRYTQQTAESLYRAGIRATKDGAS